MWINPRLLLLALLILVFITGCISPTDTPPTASHRGEPIKGGGTRGTGVNVVIESITIHRLPTDLLVGNTAQLSLLVFMTDGRSIDQYLSYFGNTAVTVSAGSELTYLGASYIGYYADQVGDEVYIWIIAVDNDDNDMAVDVGTSVLLDEFGQAVEEWVEKRAVQAAARTNLISMLLGAFFDIVYDAIEEQDLIGQQAFLLRREEGWNEGSFTLDSDDGALTIVYRVEIIENPDGQPDSFPVQNGPAISPSEESIGQVPTEPLRNPPTKVPIDTQVPTLTLISPTPTAAVPTVTLAPTLTPLPTVTPVPTGLTATVNALTGVNLRSGPGTNYPTLGSAQPGALISVLAVYDDWAYVSLDDQFAWISAQFVGTSERLSSLPTIQALGITFCDPVRGPFAGEWAKVHWQLGCASTDAQTSMGTSQPFQNGLMVWRGDNREVYIILNSGAWAVYEEDWVEGETLTCNGQFIARGFGQVYCDNSELRRLLGTAARRERPGSPITVQMFENGLIFSINSVGRRVLFSSERGDWQ